METRSLRVDEHGDGGGVDGGGGDGAGGSQCRDPGEFAKRAAALSMKKCGQVAKMAEALLLGEPVEIPPADTADGELL